MLLLRFASEAAKDARDAHAFCFLDEELCITERCLLPNTRRVVDMRREPAAHAVDLLLVNHDLQDVLKLLQEHLGVDGVKARALLFHQRAIRIELVLNISHDFLDDILDRDHARRAAVLIDDNGELRALLLHRLQKAADGHGLGHDERIGRRALGAGIGFGGGCLPKDIRAFQARADELGVGDALTFLAEVDKVNDTMRAGVIRTVRRLLGDRLARATVTVLGAAFKPDSDDMRNSPALDLAVELAHLAKRVVVHDPAAGPILAERSNRPYEVALSARSALEGTDLVLIGTEWREYRDLDPAQAADLARTRYVIDGRNCLDAQAWKAAGWSYRGIGRR